MTESFTGTCFMCGDEIPTGAYCSEECRKEHELIIEARPKLAITDAMMGESLTAMEWVNVLNEAAARLISHGLLEEWQDGRLDKRS